MSESTAEVAHTLLAEAAKAAEAAGADSIGVGDLKRYLEAYYRHVPPEDLVSAGPCCVVRRCEEDLVLGEGLNGVLRGLQILATEVRHRPDLVSSCGCRRNRRRRCCGLRGRGGRRRSARCRRCSLGDGDSRHGCGRGCGMAAATRS